MTRVFLNQKIEDPNNIIINDKETINKLIKVLRLSVGSTFFIW